MKKILLLLSSILSYSVYAQSTTVQNISAAEIESEYLAQYRASPNYSLAEEKHMKEMWRKYVPPYVKFMRVPSSTIIMPTKQKETLGVTLTELMGHFL